MIVFLKEVKKQQNNHRMTLFMSGRVSLPRIGLILKKFKIGPRSNMRPFCTKAEQLVEEKDLFIKYFVFLFQEVEKYAKLVDSIQYNSQKVDVTNK